MTKFRNWILVWGAALVFGPICHGQPAGEPPPREPAGSEFFVPSVGIIGTVRDASGAPAPGVPAPGVPVTFYPGQYPGAPEPADATTDKNGQYLVILRDKNNQPWNPAADLDRLWIGPINPSNCLMARDFGRNLVAIQEFSRMPSNLDLNLQPGITLSGSVKTAAGAPMSNIVMGLSFLSGNSFLQFRPRPDNTDARGLFSVSALPQGRNYYLNPITAPGYGTAGGQLKNEDSHTNRYEFPAFVLKPANRTLAGQVLGPDGRPVARAKVSYWGDGQRMERGEPVTDDQGRFAFDAVCEGPVTITASQTNSSGNVAAQGGDTNVIVRLGIRGVNPYGSGPPPNPPRRITGTVRDPSGAPAGGLALALWEMRGGWETRVQTDAAGHYEVNWQPRLAGDASFSLIMRDAERGWFAYQMVGEQTTNLDLRLQEGLTLSAQVRDGDGHAISNAVATVMLWVPALPNSGGLFGKTLRDPVSSDDQGRFRLAGLPPGQRYTVRIEAPFYALASLELAAEETKTNLLELRPFVLSAMDRNVAGEVLGADGEPAAGIQLSLAAQGLHKKTTSDATGHFIFAQVTAGPVNIQFDPDNFSSIPPAYRGDDQTGSGGMSGYGFSFAGTPYLYYNGSARAAGGDTNVVVKLHVNPDRYAPPVRLTTSGTVFDPSGAPAPGVMVSMPPRVSSPQPVQTDAGGNYQIPWQTDSGPRNSARKAFLLGRDLGHNLAVIAAVDATTTNSDLHLKSGLTLSGAAQDSEGKPVKSAIVQLVLYPGEAGFLWYDLLQTNVSAQGLFSFSALPQGARYELQVAAAGYGSNSISVPSSVTQTNQLRYLVVLKTANLEVAGHVIGLDGKPCRGAQVIVNGEGQPANKVGSSDSSGHFVIQQVCEGLLDVRATLPASPVNPQYGYLAGYLQAHGGETNLAVQLGLSNGVPILGPGGVGPVPATPRQ